MLARASDHVPEGPDYIYEVKWDGLRALVALDEGQIRLYGRDGTDFTPQFPELLVAEPALRLGLRCHEG